MQLQHRRSALAILGLAAAFAPSHVAAAEQPQRPRGDGRVGIGYPNLQAMHPAQLAAMVQQRPDLVAMRPMPLPQAIQQVPNRAVGNVTGRGSILLPSSSAAVVTKGTSTTINVPNSSRPLDLTGFYVDQTLGAFFTINDVKVDRVSIMSGGTGGFPASAFGQNSETPLLELGELPGGANLQLIVTNIDTTTDHFFVGGFYGIPRYT